MRAVRAARACVRVRIDIIVLSNNLKFVTMYTFVSSSHGKAHNTSLYHGV